MITWIIGVLVTAWIVVSAIILISLCMMSSRFNSNDAELEAPQTRQTGAEAWESLDEPVSKLHHVSSR
jgi:hypothetical protein